MTKSRNNLAKIRTIGCLISLALLRIVSAKFDSWGSMNKINKLLKKIINFEDSKSIIKI
jgi:hypothetical protein